MRSFGHFAFSSQVINIVKVECAAFVLLVAFVSLFCNARKHYYYEKMHSNDASSKVSWGELPSEPFVSAWVSAVCIWQLGSVQTVHALVI